jgi:hypothetical protein
MKNLLAIALLTGLAAGQAHAGCSLPPPPQKIPDGWTATKAEMLAAAQVVKDYDKAINVYNACLPFERDPLVAKPGDQLTAAQKNALRRIEDEKHNAAVDQLQSVADRFNQQVRIFNSRSEKK